MTNPAMTLLQFKDPKDWTPFERFFKVEWENLLTKDGGPIFAQGLAVVGWERIAAGLLFEALGSPDYRGQPIPKSAKAMYRELKRPAPKPAVVEDDPFAALDMQAEPAVEDDPFADLL